MSRTRYGTRPWAAGALRLLATAAILLLVFGMPLWLAVIAGRPSLHVDIGVFRQAISHRDPGDVRQIGAFLGQVAVVLAWLCWVWLTVCIVLEVLAWRSGRSTVGLPASRSVQYAVALMVGAAFAAGTLGHVSLHGGGAGSARGDVHIGGPPSESSTGSDGPRTTAHDGWQAGGNGTVIPLRVVEPSDRPTNDAGATDDFAPSVHTVCHRETLWSIAEDRLGSPHRWRDLAALNYGIRQPDGSCLTADHWIAPEWRLVLPQSHRPIVADRTVGGRVLDASAATVEPVTIRDAPSVPVVPLGAGIMGVGVTDLLDRLRRVQQRHRARGGRIRLPDPVLQSFERRVRAGDGTSDVDVIESALAALATSPAAWPAGVRLTGVRIDEDCINLMFDSELAVAPGPPFSPESGGCTVNVERAAVTAPSGRQQNPGRQFSSPTLVSVGRNDGVLFMVDLEGYGSVAIEGGPLLAEGVNRALAVELATSRWAPAFDLVLVGFDASLALTGQATVAPEAGPVISDLSWRRLTRSVRLDDEGIPSAGAARRFGVAGDWRPVVVVCAPGIPTDDVAALFGLAGDGRHGICVIGVPGVGDDAPKARLRLGSSVEVLGASVVPQSLDPIEFEHTGDLLRAARVLDVDVDTDGGDDIEGCITAGPDIGGRQLADDTGLVVPSVDAVASGSPAVSAYQGVRAGTSRGVETNLESSVTGLGTRNIPPPATAVGVEVEVAVLGPVCVRGAARPFTRAWALELVVYLAMHPGGASNDLWATALWPERLMAPSSLHSTASVARRSLGKALDGSDHLPRCHGRLALAGTVATDWDRFQELAASNDPEQWEHALMLVRGRPFEGIRSADWTLLDGTAPAIESAVVDVSGRLAGFRLRSGDPHRAEWAARKGLLVSPYDERLYRMLLRTADSAGHPGGVEAVMAELVRVVADEVEPIESVHPSTLALYRSLSRRNHQALRSADSGSR